MMCVKNSGDALLVMFVLAVGLHAMLELPIHHAYFLLPLGLVVGVIDIRLQNTQVFFSNFKSTILIWLVATLLFAVIVRDYFLVEESYNELRLEKSRVLSKVQRLPPDVLLLTQLRDFIILARLQPSPPMTIEQVEWIRKVALTYPNPPNLLKLATALALKGQTLEAQNFLKRLCVLSRAEQCAFAKTSWLVLQSKFPQLEAVNWPSQEK